MTDGEWADVMAASWSRYEDAIKNLFKEIATSVAITVASAQTGIPEETLRKQLKASKDEQVPEQN